MYGIFHIVLNIYLGLPTMSEAMRRDVIKFQI